MRIIIIVLTVLLAACSSSPRLKPPKALPYNWQGQQGPELVRKTHAEYKNYNRVSQNASLWSSSPKSLFGDRRASQLGDILTVVIDLDEEAQLQNSTSVDYSSNRNMELSSLLGIPELVGKILPNGASLKPAIDITNTNAQAGKGNISRKEKMTLRLAARVREVHPNGYLSIIGRQEIIVNDELRYLQVSGLVRVADISRLNIITYDKIADARIFYGGRGQITRANEEKSGQKILGKILPF